MKALLYCTKGMPALFYDVISKQYMYGIDTPRDRFSHRLNGQIVAEVEIDEVEIFTTDYRRDYEQNGRISNYSCVSLTRLIEYQGENQFLYALHLTNLKVFDKPKELSEYYLFDPDYCILKEVKKAPQNMCRVVESHELIEVPSKEYVLISIQPHHLCRILNGRKTIEVRRKVLNCLKEMCKNG